VYLLSAKMKSNQLSEPQIIQKLESFCAYRERCESEVRQKLYQLAVEDSDTDFYLNYLKENNFLNEERFVSAFARGKFNIKSWGKRKIMQELQSKRIDSKKIQQSINAIDEGAYFLRLQDILEKKIRRLKNKITLKRNKNLFSMLCKKAMKCN
jgi:regulatory protein